MHQQTCEGSIQPVVGVTKEQFHCFLTSGRRPKSHQIKTTCVLLISQKQETENRNESTFSIVVESTQYCLAIDMSPQPQYFSTFCFISSTQLLINICFNQPVRQQEVRSAGDQRVWVVDECLKFSLGNCRPKVLPTAALINNTNYNVPKQEWYVLDLFPETPVHSNHFQPTNTAYIKQHGSTLTAGAQVVWPSSPPKQSHAF